MSEAHFFFNWFSDLRGPCSNVMVGKHLSFAKHTQFLRDLFHEVYQLLKTGINVLALKNSF